MPSLTRWWPVVRLRYGLIGADTVDGPKGDTMSVRGWWAIGVGLCALVAVGSGTAQAQVSVAQSNQKKTLDCAGQDASITGSLNEITLTGECPAVTIKGSENTIAVEAVGTIRVVGTKNKVTWQRSTVEKGPRVTRSGLGNLVSQAPAMVPAGGDAAAPAPVKSTAGAAPAAPSPSTSASASKGEAAKAAKPAASAAPVVVSDEKSTRTIDCRGRGITVMGNGNTLTLRGTCRKVDVQGNDNIISVDAVQAIETTGNHNRVTWNRAAEGETPSTSDLGNGNAIRRATAPLP
jgi:hypothetical protein